MSRKFGFLTKLPDARHIAYTQQAQAPNATFGLDGATPMKTPSQSVQDNSTPKGGGFPGKISNQINKEKSQEVETDSNRTLPETVQKSINLYEQLK